MGKQGQAVIDYSGDDKEPASAMPSGVSI